MSESYAHPEVLVTTTWVSEHLDDTSVVIAEVNTDLQAAYYQGHVPGAVGWSLHTDLEEQTRRDIPTLSQLERLLSRSGIDNDTTIVLYGDGNNRSATWAFWVLKYYRHSDVRLMNGGRTKWVDEGRPVSTDTPNPEMKTYRARHTGQEPQSDEGVHIQQSTGCLYQASGYPDLRGVHWRAELGSGHSAAGYLPNGTYPRRRPPPVG